MRVIFFERAPSRGRHSLERVFEIVRSALPAATQSNVFRVPSPRARPWDLAYNTLRACKVRGDINHITGDIHYVALGLDPAKTVLTIHDCCHLANFSGVKRWIMEKLWYEKPVELSRVVTTISSWTAQELCRLVPSAKGKIRVIHNPVPAEYHYAPKRFNHRNPVLLQVGTRRPNKNLDRVAQAIKGIPCTLDIVGPLDEVQRKGLIELGISFRNYVHISAAEVQARYIAADAVLFVSTFEGFGMPIAEAQAIGRPVITSTVASMPEVAGEGACLVDPFDVEAIRTAVLRVLHDGQYRNQLVEQGLENVKRFTPEGIAQQYYELYSEICGQ